MKKFLVGSFVFLMACQVDAATIYNYIDKPISYCGDHYPSGSLTVQLPPATINTNGEMIPSVTTSDVMGQCEDDTSKYISSVDMRGAQVIIFVTPSIIEQFKDNYATKMQLKSKIAEYDAKVAGYDKTLADKIAEMQKVEESHLAALDTNVESKVNNLVNNSDLVATAVNTKLDDTKSSADGLTQLEVAVKTSFDNTREKNYADTTLPSGTFYVKSTAFTNEGDFKVTPAQLNGILQCGISGQTAYFVDMKDTSKADTLVSQLLSAYVTDSKVTIDSVQNSMADGGLGCRIKSVSIEK